MKKTLFLLFGTLALAACGSDGQEDAAPEQSVKCNITAPRDGAQVSAAEPLVILGTAYTQNGSIIRTELRVGGEPIAEVTSAPFSYQYTFPADTEEGALKIELTVEGDKGVRATDVVTVTVVKPAGPSKPQPTEPVTTGTMTDARDGSVYATVTLGSQTWMAENLRWMPAQHKDLSLTEPHYYSVFDEDIHQELGAKYLEVFGAYYNRPAALQGAEPLAPGEKRTIRGACPEGWHIPAQEEWAALAQFVLDAGTAAIAADGTPDETALAKALASDNSDEVAPKWIMPEFIEGEEQPTWVGVYPEFNNALLFNGIPAGYRACMEKEMETEIQPIWDHLGYSAGWWSATAATKMEPYERFGVPVRMWSDQQRFVVGDSEFRVDCALPVRCVKD